MVTTLSATLSSLRLLIVEDQPEDAELVTALLRRQGHTPAAIALVDNADAFVKELEQSPDLILCDYHLPCFSAMAALALLQERELDIPFIIISGSIGEETAVAAIKCGASDYLLKDRLGRLGAAISVALEQKNLRVSARRAEEDLRQSEHKYRCLFGHLLDAAFLCDAGNGRIIDTNGRGERMLGLERAQILGSRLNRFVPAAACGLLLDMKGSEEDSAAEFRSEVTGDGRFPVPVQIGATIVTIYDRRLLLTMFRDLGDRPTVI